MCSSAGPRPTDGVVLLDRCEVLLAGSNLLPRQSGQLPTSCSRASSIYVVYMFTCSFTIFALYVVYMLHNSLYVAQFNSLYVGQKRNVISIFGMFAHMKNWQIKLTLTLTLTSHYTEENVEWSSSCVRMPVQLLVLTASCSSLNKALKEFTFFTHISFVDSDLIRIVEDILSTTCRTAQPH